MQSLVYPEIDVAFINKQKVITVDLTLKYSRLRGGAGMGWLCHIKRGDPDLIRIKGASSPADFSAIEDLRASGEAVELVNE